MLLLQYTCNWVLPQRGYKVRALTRKPEQTKQLFSNHPNLEVGVLVYTFNVVHAAYEAAAVLLKTPAVFNRGVYL
jgi:uncharacterized protein YbjT (DUF2867 family)